MRRRLVVSLLAGAAALLVGGFLLPEKLRIPVEGATKADWNRFSFWCSPWGASGVHKGIDIFAREGTPVRAATGGVVLFAGTLPLGGNAVCVLGPKWRVHYYAHMESIGVRVWRGLGAGDEVGRVGRTGNAAATPPHLHYAIVTPVPYPWEVRGGAQGWKRMFYLDPDARLRRS